MRRSQKRRVSPFAAGMIALLVLVAALYAAFIHQYPWSNPYELKATFANADNALWPGQFVDVVLTLTSRTAIVVPSHAIQPGQQGPFVFVVKADATVESRPVVPGTRLGAETIIEQGLRPGERVVTDGQIRLVPGAKVDVRPTKAS